MEGITKALLKINSNDAVIVADKYISYKYTELFCCIGLAGVLVLVTAMVLFFAYKCSK